MRQRVALPRVYEDLLAQIARQMMPSGGAPPPREVLEKKADAIIQAIKGQNNNTLVVIDHTLTLLALARLQRRAGQNEVACVLYAMWLEHKLNSFIATNARRTVINDSEITELIRGTDHRAKLALIHIFANRSMSVLARDRIARILELRNNFVHYKWKPLNPTLKQQYARACVEAEMLVRQLGVYEEKHLGRVSISKARRLLRLTANHA